MPGAHIKEIHDVKEFENFLKNNQLVVVDFHAVWCGPCKVIAPKYEELSQEFHGVSFVKVDVDQAEELAEKQGVESMPTFKFFKNGQLVDTLNGAKFEELKKRLHILADNK